MSLKQIKEFYDKKEIDLLVKHNARLQRENEELKRPNSDCERCEKLDIRILRLERERCNDRKVVEALKTIKRAMDGDVFRGSFEQQRLGLQNQGMSALGGLGGIFNWGK